MWCGTNTGSGTGVLLQLVYVVLALVVVVLVLSQCWWCECDPVPRITQVVCGCGNSGAHGTWNPCSRVPHIGGCQCHIFTRPMPVGLVTHAEHPSAPSVAATATTASQPPLGMRKTSLTQNNPIVTKLEHKSEFQDIYQVSRIFFKSFLRCIFVMIFRLVANAE